MGPNLKRNFIHILKSNNEISFRCSSHFSLALMISRSERRGERGGEIPKVLWLCSFINDLSPFVTAVESFDESLSWRKSSRLIILRGERSCFAGPPSLVHCELLSLSLAWNEFWPFKRRSAERHELMYIHPPSGPLAGFVSYCSCFETASVRQRQAKHCLHSCLQTVAGSTRDAHQLCSGE